MKKILITLSISIGFTVAVSAQSAITKPAEASAAKPVVKEKTVTNAKPDKAVTVARPADETISYKVETVEKPIPDVMLVDAAATEKSVTNNVKPVKAVPVVKPAAAAKPSKSKN